MRIPLPTLYSLLNTGAGVATAKRVQWLLLAMLALALAAFVLLDLGRFLRLDALQSSQAALAALYAERPWTVRAAYFLLYVAVAGLSLPGAAMLTLAGVAFWPGLGLLLVSFASSIGATLSFLAARFVLRDAVQTHFGPRLAELNRGVQHDGALYLFSLRLIPVVPFFAINLAMGLSPLRTWTFYWVSQLGMLASTAAYVNAGTQIATLRSLQDVASPGLMGALFVLGLLPWLAKAVLQLLHRPGAQR